MQNKLRLFIGASYCLNPMGFPSPSTSFNLLSPGSEFGHCPAASNNFLSLSCRYYRKELIYLQAKIEDKTRTVIRQSVSQITNA